MADRSRILKLSILAETKDLVDGLKKADNEVDSSSGRLSESFKKVGAALAVATAAAAAYAGKLLIDGVKSAIEDQAAQEKLANTLKNVTGATNAQVKATEDYITQTSLAVGIADDELRPSLSRLAIATGDVTKAQQLQKLALDVAAGSGKSLETVTTALAKAYEGNNSSLGRLGVGLSATELKSMSFEEITASLADTFENSASKQADTFQGKLQRLQIGFDETKEAIGERLLPILTNMLSFVTDKIIPAITRFTDTFTKGSSPAIDNFQKIIKNFVIPVLKALWEFIDDFIIPILKSVFEPIIRTIISGFAKLTDVVKENKDNYQPLLDLLKVVATFIRDNLAPVIGTVLGKAFGVIIDLIGRVISIVGRLIDYFDGLIRKVRDFIASLADIPGVDQVANFIGGLFGRANGGAVRMNQPYIVGERGAEVFVPSTSGKIVPDARMSRNQSQPIIYNISINGQVIDPEGTARSISKILNDSKNRAGSLAGIGVPATYGSLVVT